MDHEPGRIPKPHERPSLGELAGQSALSCPDCGCNDFRVYRSQPWGPGGKPRQRMCRNCKRIVYTREIVDEEEISRESATGDKS